MVKIFKYVYYYLDFDASKSYFPHVLNFSIRFKSLRNVAPLINLFQDFLQNLFKDKTIIFEYAGDKK